MQRILITGVRAKTGAPLAQLLSGRSDVEVRGGSSDPSRVRVDGVEPVAFSWDDRTTWRPAVRDADAVFVVRPDRADAPELVADLAASAPEHTHLVLLSDLDAGYHDEDDWTPRVERAVSDSGRTWTTLRPNWFMQVFTDRRFLRDELVQDGRLTFPSGGQPVSWIDARDIAAVAAHALTDPGRHAGRGYDLTGPEALSLPRTAQLLAAGLGRPVEHVEPSMEDALADLEGFDRYLTEGAYDRIRLGLATAVTDTVERVTGRPACSLEELVADHGAFGLAAGR